MKNYTVKKLELAFAQSKQAQKIEHEFIKNFAVGNSISDVLPKLYQYGVERRPDDFVYEAFVHCVKYDGMVYILAEESNRKCPLKNFPDGKNCVYKKFRDEIFAFTRKELAEDQIKDGLSLVEYSVKDLIEQMTEDRVFNSCLFNRGSDTEYMVGWDILNTFFHDLSWLDSELYKKLWQN